MALRLRRRTPTPVDPSRNGHAPPGLVGTARLDRRTKRLASRLKPGNIAIIDHEELDRIAAESLVEHGVAAVVNARASVSDRYPNLGPLVLAAANIPILDGVGEDVFTRINEGDDVRLDGNKLFFGDDVVAEGTILTEDAIRASMDAAHSKLSRTV